MFLALLQPQYSSLIRPFLDEILRARIRTLGIAEYKFQLDTSMYPRFAAQPGRHLMAAAGNVLERQWVVYDVGGHTSLVSHLAIHSAHNTDVLIRASTYSAQNGRNTSKT